MYLRHSVFVVVIEDVFDNSNAAQVVEPAESLKSIISPVAMIGEANCKNYSTSKTILQHSVMPPPWGWARS